MAEGGPSGTQRNWLIGLTSSKMYNSLYLTAENIRFELYQSPEDIECPPKPKMTVKIHLEFQIFQFWVFLMKQ